MRAKDFLSEAINKDVIRLQRELKAAGADLGRYGPAKDGIDGRMGPKTRAAMQQFPEIAVKHKQSVANVPHASDAEVAQADATDARPAMPHTATPADAYKPDVAVDTKAKPKYDGIDPIVRDRMGMPPATTAEIDAYMKAHPAVVSNVVDGSGKPIISGGAKEVERAARQAAKEYETKTGQNPNISQDTRDAAGISDNAVDVVKKLEGFSAKAFWDHKQYSIGYGTKASGPNEVITEPEAASKMKSVLNKSAQYVINFAKTHGYKWGQNQIDALSSFIYNGGKGFLDQVTKGGKRTNQEIAQAIPQYNKASGKVEKGLVKRRNIEVAMFKNGLATDKEVA